MAAMPSARLIPGAPSRGSRRLRGLGTTVPMGAGSAGFGFLIRLYGHPFLAWSQSAENVVPDEPSLRCLPKILMTEQRMAFDMAIYSIDLVEIAMARLRYTAGHMMSKYPEEIQGDLKTRRGMYMDAWSLVNSVHDLRTVLMKFPGKFELPEIEAFIRETEVATHLRNGIDHLPANIGNLAKKKSPSALFGGLSFIWAYECRPDGAPLHARICVVATGHFHRENETVNVADPFSLNELPLGVFTLSAFDCKINLSDMARKVAAFGEFLNQAVGSHIKAVVVARAQELGVSTDSLLEHAAADGMFIIEWTYNYDSPAPESLMPSASR